MIDANGIIRINTSTTPPKGVEIRDLQVSLGRGHPADAGPWHFRPLLEDLLPRRVWTVANIDLTFVGTNVEFEDCDFWGDALIICTYSAITYILRF